MAGLEASLRELATLLHELYGTPHLGNWQDPTDEFAYIILSRKTAERAYFKAFTELKSLGSWTYVSSLDEDEITQVIYGCGLEQKKAIALLEGLHQIKTRFGKADLARASRLDDDSLFTFLASLPEVGPKSALCIMLYAFDRTTFPVDAHVGRVLARLGIFSSIGLDLTLLDHKGRQRALVDLVPPDCRYGLHVNLIAHGRNCCRAVTPLCHQCSLSDRCQYAARQRSGEQRKS